MNKFFLQCFLITLLICITSCKSNDANTILIPFPSEILAKAPIEGTDGKYVLPYTSDGVLTEWVEIAIDANIGEDLGGLVGSLLGRQLVGNVPFIGSTLGQNVGENIGRATAINAIGGIEVLKESSDLSFDSLEDMSRYLYKNHFSHPYYLPAIKATMVFYPELKGIYNEAIINAPRW
ncbi:hypothetical protein L3081_18650 [Colwellia sp. MSW7]|jgi:hypothetical protein|uniref:Uncharacterized protein n=1 Tax=Colwellia maritima TaxID=2912588 RepID=A0ABS9X5I8_9GAMM|nr:hypothetical protein [Colwellia maritima]MCI2285042.1 hypothetical protein [Colwellia maritima]